MIARLRFGVLSYLNCLPATLALEQGGVGGNSLAVERGTPAELNFMMRTGALDLSVVSVAEYLMNRDLYSPLEGFSLWCDGEVQSVCLFSPLSREELMGPDILVGVTPESATSVALAEILTGGAKTTPFQSLEQAEEGLVAGLYQAVLLIGDRALEPPAWCARYQKHDLGAWWHDASSYPMTYAIWVARQDLEPAKKMEAQGLLSQSLAWGESHLQTVLEEGALRSGLTTSRLASYLKRIQYRSSPASQIGFEEFSRRLCGVMRS